MRTDRIIAVASAAVFALTPASDASAQQPLSAIDWLSDSLELPVPEVLPKEDEPNGSNLPEVSVSEIGARHVDAVGLLSPSRFGLTSDVWGRSSAADIAELIAGVGPGDRSPPSAVRLFGDLMLLRLDPPVDAASDDSLFVARLDTLLSLGRVGDAARLVSLAPAVEPDYFRRLFDAALLTGSEQAACRTIEETPDLSPTYMARVFCLARNGEWDVAALTLGTAQALDIVSPEDEALILYFLDPEFDSDVELPQPPRLPTPLQFRMYEAIGERIPTDTLPIAYAHADLTDIVGWQTRLRAAERLTAAGAMAPRELIRTYTERAPAASGGVWSRVDAMQRFLEAARERVDPAIEASLAPAWSEMTTAGMHATMAPWFAQQLGDIQLTGAARHAAFEIALYADAPSLARRMADTDGMERFLLALLDGTPDAAPPPDRLAQSVVRGLTENGVPDRYAALVEDARQGEALLAALSDLLDGAVGNPDRTADALILLRHLGLSDAARRIAVEIMLLEGAA